MRRRKWRACRAASLLEIHRAHFENFGVDLPLGEEDDPDEVDRILAWRAAR